MLLRSAQAELPAERPGDVEVLGAAGPRRFCVGMPVSAAIDRSAGRVMCNGDAARHFTRFLDQIAPGRVRVRPTVTPPEILPLEPLDRTYHDRLLVVGDAADGKSTTGGGSITASSPRACGPDAGGPLRALVDRALAETRPPGSTASRSSMQLVLRIAQRLTDPDIDGLFDLARTDGIMPLMRQTAAFNHHREFIVALLKHPPARRLLFKSALG
jgi:hypothetical protein